ncbi:Gfo/Idh/MocA family oxidoreductase [Niabella sp. CC-SYL272]|uniref:Gfo/Idh/MocA family protein n=1 Tax=Niabella agricola TaxID=2891571 RepID=UPI001F455D0D|nr:Gfo/Idh/MocA family oxidoreductase [Niabella agricola]MCF3112106.1 Gfo/Idh/MocA family oxidoreductase [Niabella agricola]
MRTRRNFIQKMGLSALGLYTIQGLNANSILRLQPKVADGPVLRVALMGLGGYATRVAESMQQSKRAKITGLISGTPEKLKTWGAKYNVPENSRYNYENFDAIRNNPDIDAVYVITPNALHHNQVIRSARAGKHVICEKPMGLNAKEGREMVDVCKKAGKKLLVGYRMHFEPLTLEIHRMRTAGELGAIKFFQGLSGFRLGDPTQWRVNKALAGGGALMDIGIYALNGCRYMVGEEPVWVTAQETKTDSVKFKEGVDETITFQLGFPSGATASCLSSYNMNNLDRFFLNGDKGFAELQPASSYGPIKGRTHKGPLDIANDRPQQATQMDEMAAIILDDKKPVIPVDGEEGLRDLVIIDAIYKAVKTGGKIKLG